MDFSQRREEFLKRHKANMEEFKCDIFGYPAFMPTGEGDFKVVIQFEIVDIENKSVPSPFVQS